MDRGRLLSPRVVVERYFPVEDGERPITPRWVCENVKPRIKLSRTRVVFYERDVEAWIEAQRAA